MLLTRSTVRTLLTTIATFVLGSFAPRSAHAESCFIGDFFPMDINWVGPASSTGLIPVDPNPGNGIREIRSIQVDLDGNGSAESTFPLPFEAQDAINYFLSPSRTFILATACPNVTGCASISPYQSNTIAIIQLAGGVATTVHTDCLGGGVLNGNGRWYEAGLCNQNLLITTQHVCTTDPVMQINAAGCNRLFMARTIDSAGDAQLRWYDLNNTTTSLTDGRGITQLRRQNNDPDLTIDAGGNAAFARHDIAVGATTYDVAVIDVCPGSPQFGQNLTSGPAFGDLNDLPASQGVCRARVASCAGGMTSVDVIRSALSGEVLVHSLSLTTCSSCGGSPVPTGRCCATSGCTVTTLANCSAGAAGWTSGMTCATACPAPAPVLSLRIDGAPSAPAGDPITITFTARNTGTGQAANARIRFILNSFYYHSLTADNSGVITSNDVTWTLGTLAAGATRVVHATFQPVCLTSSPIPISGTLLSNNGNGTVTGAYDLSVSAPTVPPITGTLTSIPSTNPLIPGSTVVHTFSLTNPTANTIRAAAFDVTVGSGMFFDVALNTAGGTLSPSGFAGVAWRGDLPANTTTIVSFRTLVSPCPFAGLQSTQFNDSGNIQVRSVCSALLVNLGPGAIIPLRPTPLSLSLVPSPGAGVGVGTGLTGDGNIDLLLRDGAPADVILRLTNNSADPVPIANAQINFGSAIDPAVDPLGPNPPAGVTYAAGILDVSTALAPSQVFDVPLHFAIAPSQSCRAAITARGGVGVCAGPNGNAISPTLTLHRVRAVPTAAHLLTFDYIDGLYTYRPGTDTELQRFLCFNFSGPGSGSIARTNAGQIVLSSPPAVFDPVALTVRPLSGLTPTPRTIVWDPSTQTLVAKDDATFNGSPLKRVNINTGAVTPLVTADPDVGPTTATEDIAVGGDGRLMWIANNNGGQLRVGDPRSPASLPLSPAAATVVTLPVDTTPLTITTDSRGDYVVSFVHLSTDRVGIARVDHISLALTIVAPDVGPRFNFPTACSAAMGTTDVFFGSVLPGAIVGVNLQPPATVSPSTISGFPGVLDMAAVGAGCVADFDDGSGTGTPDGGVGIEDLLYYLFVFDAGVVRADVDDGSNTGAPDGGVGIEDLLYFLARLDLGC